MSENEPGFMTELEARLAGPGGSAHRDELCNGLEVLGRRLRFQIAEGVPRAEFADWQAAADAVAAAGEVLRRWPVGKPGESQHGVGPATDGFDIRRKS